jgi:hypothetical protein
MRTIFEDVDERANQEDPDKRRSNLALWLIAVLSLGGAYGAWYYVSNRKPPVPPPPPVSLEDDSQITRAAQAFNDLIKEDKWDEAQQMLSPEGLARLQEEKKSLRESVLDPKNQTKKVVEALPTPSRANTPSTSRIDCAYLFDDRDTQIVPLTFVIENGKLMLNSW